MGILACLYFPPALYSSANFSAYSLVLKRCFSGRFEDDVPSVNTCQPVLSHTGLMPANLKMLFGWSVSSSAFFDEKVRIFYK